jgi:hypothetical protein
VKRLLIALGAIIGVVVAGVVACSLVYPSFHIRYRLEFEVKVNDSVRLGSSVIEVVYSIFPDKFTVNSGMTGIISQINGYAVTTDLGDRGLMFAVFRTENYDYSVGYTPLIAYGLDAPLSPSELKKNLQLLERKSGWIDVPERALPLLIRFRNIDDPWSAEKIDPKNLSAFFGDGVSLVRVRLRLTDEPVTAMPSNWPTWMKALQIPDNLGGVRNTSEAPLGLQGVEFKGR